VRQVACLIASVVLSACASAPQAELGAKAPDAVRIEGDVEHFEIANRLEVQIDVSAGAAYTISFPRLSGSFTLAPQTPEASAIEIVIDTTSAQASWDVVADVAKAEFLHTAEFPEARFTSRALRKRVEGGLMLYGDLSLHGKTIGLSVPLTLTISRCNVGVGTEFAIDRRAFGAISSGSVDAVVSDNVVVRIQGTVPRKGPKCPQGEAPPKPPKPTEPPKPVEVAPAAQPLPEPGALE
jgi:polyisoprenoid-binding protein YceI